MDVIVQENTVTVEITSPGAQGPIGPIGQTGPAGTGQGSNISNYVSGVSVTGYTAYTGLINVSGIGTITVFTGINNQILISGSSVGVSADHGDGINLSGNLYITGQSLYNLLINESGVLTSTIIATGQGLQTQINNINNLSGSFYPSNNPFGFANSGNLQNTGQNLYNIITGFSGVFNNSGSQYQSQINTFTVNLTNTGVNILNILNNYTGYNNTNPSGFISGFNSGQYALVSNLQLTGQALYQYITNTSGNLDIRLYQTGSNLLSLISASSAGVGSINGQSGILTFTGAGNVVVIVSGQNFTISGDTGNYNNFAQKTDVTITGVNLGDKIDSLSGFFISNTGQFYSISNPQGYATSGNLQTTGQAAWIAAQNNAVNLSGNITQTGVNLGSKIDSLSGWFNNTSRVSSISVTGFSPAFTGQIGISGAGSVTVFTGINNNIIISGVSLTEGSTLPFVLGNVNVVSGSGNSQFIAFSQNFTTTPIVLGNMFNNSGDSIVGFQTSGISTNGFYLNFSDILSTNNYYFQYLATTGLGYFDIATSLISQITVNSPQNHIGSGSPEGIVSAISGSLYTDWYNQSLYMKISGNGTNPYGWV